jgi:hypothetical protein
MLVHRYKLEEQNKISIYHSMDLNIFCGLNHNQNFIVFTFMNLKKNLVKQTHSNVVKQMHKTLLSIKHVMEKWYTSHIEPIYN